VYGDLVALPELLVPLLPTLALEPPVVVPVELWLDDPQAAATSPSAAAAATAFQRLPIKV
jgi:hypothetical protein